MVQVEIYTKDYCPYCVRAKELLKSKHVEFVEYDVTHDEAKLQEMLGRSEGRRTVPQIFIDHKAYGGFDDINALNQQGKLDPLLK